MGSITQPYQMIMSNSEYKIIKCGTGNTLETIRYPLLVKT